MKIRLICYEDIDGWILGKFVKNLNRELDLLGFEVTIDNKPDYSAEINHHMIYNNYDGKKTTIDTMMVTHVNSFKKLRLIRKQLINAEMAICMSSETKNELIAAGMPANKLTYINPAQDGVIRPRKIVVGITSRVYHGGRKRENILITLSEKLNPKEFSFKIMGSGWGEIIEKVRDNGFEIDYYPEFDYDRYIKIIPTFDYYLYFGFDEGSMGFLDALSAGVQTMVTPQGFHLDAKGGISHPIQNSDDIYEVFEKIIMPRRNLIKSVEDWTWKNYAIKHAQIWEDLYLKYDKTYKPIIQGRHPDGNLSDKNIVINPYQKYLLNTSLFIKSIYKFWKKSKNFKN